MMSQISISHLSFNYESSYENIFEDVSFTVIFEMKSLYSLGLMIVLTKTGTVSVFSEEEQNTPRDLKI